MAAYWGKKWGNGFPWCLFLYDWVSAIGRILVIISTLLVWIITNCMRTLALVYFIVVYWGMDMGHTVRYDITPNAVFTLDNLVICTQSG